MTSQSADVYTASAGGSVAVAEASATPVGDGLDKYSSILMIFVDGLPFDDRSAVVPPDWHSVPHIPTLGYSVNIEAELFAGATAEDLGWFCEWNPGASRNRWQIALAKLAALTRRNEYMDYAAHRLLDRLYGERIYNVPLECIGQLQRDGRLPYEQGFPRETLFQKFDIRFLEQSAPGDTSDDDVVRHAIERIASGERRLFVPLVQLDSLTHAHGLTGDIRQDHLVQLRDNIATLWQAMLASDPTALAVLISDHGFADVTLSVDVHMPSLLKRTGGIADTVYTVESTLARIWCKGPTQRDAVSHDLSMRDYGRVLSTDERRQYSIADKRFGDVIFVANEGVTFVPCTMTKRTVCAGMHGYLPDSPTQWGLISTSAPIFDGPARSSEFYHVLAGA
jgi:hypothetical protein